MEKLFVYLTNLSTSGAYFIIFGVLLACGIGFPLPEDIPLLAAGYLCWDGTMEIGVALFVTLAGVLIGDTMLFFIGRKMGPAILEKQSMQAIFSPRRVQRSRAYFRKYGDKIVFFARFVAGLRAVVFFIAGTMKMRFLRFIWLDMMAAIFSVPIWIGIGYGIGHLFGESIVEGLHYIKPYKNAFALTVFVIVFLTIIRVFLKFRHAGDETDSF